MIMKSLWSILTLTLVLGNSHAAETDRPANQPVNLLFIMTDQQRWDALSCAVHALLLGVSGLRAGAHGNAHGAQHRIQSRPQQRG